MILVRNNIETNVTGSIQPTDATHVAINKTEGYKNYFCYQKNGSFWTLIADKNKEPFQIKGSYCSLAPNLFDFIPVDEFVTFQVA